MSAAQITASALIFGSDSNSNTLRGSIYQWNQLYPSSQINENDVVNDLVDIINASPLFTSEIFSLQSTGRLLFAQNPQNTSDSYGETDVSTITLTLPNTGTASQIATEIASVLSHELGHFLDNYQDSGGDEISYLVASFISEGKAAYNNILISNEVSKYSNGAYSAPIDLKDVDVQAVLNNIASLNKDQSILYLATVFATDESEAPGQTYIQYPISNLTLPWNIRCNARSNIEY